VDGTQKVKPGVVVKATAYNKKKEHKANKG
jgi:hypothetical protein